MVCACAVANIVPRARITVLTDRVILYGMFFPGRPEAERGFWRNSRSGTRLEEELQSQLHNARISSIADDPKCALQLTIYDNRVTIVDLAVRISELCVIEQVERLYAKLQRFRFGNLRRLQQRHVEVVQTRAVEEATPGISELSHLLVGEQRVVEIRLSVARVRIRENLAARKIRDVHRNRVGTDEGIVIVLRQGDRKPRGKIRDPGETPPPRPSFRPACGHEPVEGKQPVVTENKIVCHVEITKANT